jgi:hypothetical protein
MDTYLYKSARKNMIVCGLHENKMTKYSNNTIMVGELPFIEIGNCSFTFLCRSGMVVFFCPKICSNKYQYTIYICAFSSQKMEL